jgi:putative pyruvate formate lyase activating enzyme
MKENVSYKKEYDLCALCPRECRAKRNEEKIGACGVGGTLKVARASLHSWEEPCISGTRGSGTVFFSGCSLGCAYCQNKEISRGERGREISAERLVEIFFELEARGAHNINLVTPSHYLPTIVYAIERARTEGLGIPFVYNTSAYEKAEEIKRLDGLIDIYLPDFKYMDKEIARKYSSADDYPEIAKKAIAEMVRQRGEARFDSDGMMTSGVIVRHLVLPSAYENSRAAIEYLYNTYKNDIYISIMSQYTPYGNISEFKELNRRLTTAEYNKVVDFFVDLELTNGFMQEKSSSQTKYIPDFDLTGVK